MLWTAKQRDALAVIGLILVSGLAVRYMANPAYVADPQPDSAARAGELLDRVDPNTADWPTLAALPSIGPAVARRIVEEREAFSASHRRRVPYAELSDLLRVKGIGEATIQNIEPYLIFPRSNRPDTRP